MKKIFLLAAIFLTITGLAQKVTVTGIAIDSLSRQPIPNATITLLLNSDSSLVSFTMGNDNGRFELKDIRFGEYRLLITHINYYNRITTFSIKDGNIADLGNVLMHDRSKILSEVTISSEAPPVTIIDDTIQYNAGSFRTPPNANVEQLLKKLPGVKVEKDGTIKAQGEKVNRVLVDGKEFFGNDPKVAIRNLPADAIDKVQVYDRQSEQAQLTGFDDGNYEKTINLTLKKDKKKGMFGKANAGVGNNKRFEGKFNLNSFKGARQMSAIAMANNTNAEGFSFMDILNFKGELAKMQMGGGGNMNINITEEDAAAFGLGGSNNPGIRTTWGSGFNYNNILGNKTDLQSNFFYNRYDPNIESHIQRQYFLPDSSYYYSQNSDNNNINSNQRLNLNVFYQLDSMNTIRIIPSLNLQQTSNSSFTDYQTLTENRGITNEGYSNSFADNKGFTFRNELIYGRKLNRKGRTLSFSLQTSINGSNGNGDLASINSFYKTDGSLLSKDTLDQRNITAATLTGYTARVAFTERIFKRSLIELSIARSKTNSTSAKNTFDYNVQNGKHDQENTLLSNNFENSYGYVHGGLRLRTQKKKYIFSVGAVWQQAYLDGKAIATIKDSLVSKTFKNLLPSARIQYIISKFKRLSINYTASTRQPDIAQLQPVPDNSNSLNIKEGNPNLRQEYNHNIQANLNLVSPYKNKNLFVFFTLQSTRNKIVNADSINALGIKRTKPVNVNGVYNINGNINYSIPLRFLKATIEVSSNISYYNGTQFINSNSNNIKALTVGPEVRLDINPTPKINLSLGTALNFSNTKYSLRSSGETKYIRQEFNGSVDWEMPNLFFLSTGITYIINSQRAPGYNGKIPLWNASLSKQVLRFNRGEIRLSAVDLLNRNIGINRISNQNYIEDSRVNTLKQFFLLSFTYSLSKTGLNNAGGGGMRIMR
ncbi:MAG: outer membrane beta-barrel protein [Ferruginibacter sp.]